MPSHASSNARTVLANSSPTSKHSTGERKTLVSGGEEATAIYLEVVAIRDHFCIVAPGHSDHQLLLRAAADVKQKSGLAGAEPVRWLGLREGSGLADAARESDIPAARRLLA